MMGHYILLLLYYQSLFSRPYLILNLKHCDNMKLKVLNKQYNVIMKEKL